MTLLWVAIAGLVSLAWLMLLPALRSSREPAIARHANANVDLLKAHLGSLDRELADGSIDVEQHQRSRTELQRRVLAESNSSDGAPAKAASRRATLLVALAIGIIAVALYSQLGNPAAVDLLRDSDSPNSADAAASRVAVEAMLSTLEKRLQAAPADASSNLEGWTMLARSYAALQRFAESDRAYARAIALSPNDAQLLADRADVLAVVQGQTSSGEPERLIERALQIDPRNLKALALSGNVAFEHKDYATAKVQWQKARDIAPAGSEFAAGLDRSLDEVRGANVDVASANRIRPGPASDDVSTAAATTVAATTAAQISGRVTLSPELASRASPTDTVFIFARAAQGPRMPLAILKRTVADLPLDFTLDDSMAMSPQMKLSAFQSVIVGARVSKSGNAMPQSGDLFAESAPTDVHESALRLIIGNVQP